MAGNVDKAAGVAGPIAAADASGMTGVYRIACTGVAQSFVLPVTLANQMNRTNWAKRFISLKAIGVNIQFAQGMGAAPTLVLNQASAVGTGHAAAGATIPSGTEVQFLVNATATHVGWISDANAGYLEVYFAETNHPSP